jgi:hypothetical protein
MIVSTLGMFTRVALWAACKRAQKKSARLEVQYVQAAKSADELARQQPKTTDPLQKARQQYELGQKVQVRDKLSDRFMSWSESADARRKRLDAFKNLKGQMIPYVLGALDALGVWALANYFPKDKVPSWALEAMAYIRNHVETLIS